MTKSKKEWKKLAKKYAKEVQELRRRVDRLERYIGYSDDYTPSSIPITISGSDMNYHINNNKNTLFDRLFDDCVYRG